MCPDPLISECTILCLCPQLSQSCFATRTTVRHNFIFILHGYYTEEFNMQLQLCLNIIWGLHSTGPEGFWKKKNDCTMMYQLILISKDSKEASNTPVWTMCSKLHWRKGILLIMFSQSSSLSLWSEGEC